MYLVIKPYTEKLANGKFTANFYIYEHYGSKFTITPGYLRKKFDTDEKAHDAAQKNALAFINEHYSKGTKYIIKVG